MKPILNRQFFSIPLAGNTYELSVANSLSLGHVLVSTFSVLKSACLSHLNIRVLGSF